MKRARGRPRKKNNIQAAINWVAELPVTKAELPVTVAELPVAVAELPVTVAELPVTETEVHVTVAPFPVTEAASSDSTDCSSDTGAQSDADTVIEHQVSSQITETMLPSSTNLPSDLRDIIAVLVERIKSLEERMIEHFSDSRPQSRKSRPHPRQSRAHSRSSISTSSTISSYTKERQWINRCTPSRSRSCSPSDCASPAATPECVSRPTPQRVTPVQEGFMAVVNGAPANRNQFVSPNFAHFNPYSVLGHEEVQRQQTHVEHEHQLQQQNDHILAQQLAQQEQVQQAQVLQAQQQQAQMLQAQQQQAQQAHQRVTQQQVQRHAQQQQLQLANQQAQQHAMYQLQQQERENMQRLVLQQAQQQAQQQVQRQTQQQMQQPLSSSNDLGQRRRPVITYGEKYVNNMQSSRSANGNPVQQRSPGFEIPPRFQRLHSNTTAQQPPHDVEGRRTTTTLVAADSMARSIRVRTINNMLNDGLLQEHSQRIQIDKFPGAHAKKIQHCFKYSLEEYKPDILVVIAGANDINYDSQTGNADPKHIATKVINIARDALSSNVSHVFVFGLIRRKNNRFKQLIEQTNMEIRLLCNELGVNYVDTSDITPSDIEKDGIHLNPEGTRKLSNMILRCNPSYNPML